MTYGFDGQHVAQLTVHGPGGSDSAVRSVSTPCY